LVFSLPVVVPVKPAYTIIYMEFLNCLYRSENKAKINMHRLQNKGEKLEKQLNAFSINTLQQ